MKAIEWAHAGFCDLIPVQPGQKVPAIRDGNGWRGLNGWTHTQIKPEKIDEWGANIGLLGRKFPGIDIDIEEEPLVLAISEVIERKLGAQYYRVGRPPRRLYPFRLAGEPIKTRIIHAARNLGQVEVRGNGAQYVLDGLHPAGMMYTWPAGRPTYAEDLPAITAEQVDEIMEEISYMLDGKRNASHGKTLIDSDEPIREGERNDTLFRMACAMRGQGCEYEEILDKLRDKNQRCCAPSLSDREVEAIARSATRYEPGPARAAGEEFSGNLLDFDFSDRGNAQRLIVEYGRDIRYCPQRDCWFIWNGAYWAEDISLEIDKRMKWTLEKFEQQAYTIADEDKRKAALKFFTRSNSTRNTEAAIRSARSEESLQVHTDRFDCDSFLLCCQNGVVDLRTGELHPHRREDYMTQCAPVEYHPEARHKDWEKFLHDATGGDEELKTYIQTIAGYSLTGSTKEEKLFFIHGPTDAGKSTFIFALRAALGSYADTTPFDTFLDSAQHGPRNDIAKMVGKRLIISSEVDKGEKLAVGLVKTLTGRDTISVRKLYKEYFEFKPQCKFWLVANDAPRMPADDNALWRRWYVIPFTHTVPEEKKDYGLKERLQHDPGAQTAILAWAVAGARRWFERGLGQSVAVQQATRNCREEQNLLSQFIEECCELDENAWTPSSELREAYDRWAQSMNVHAVGLRTWGSSLQALGLQLRRTDTARGWGGIRLRQASEGNF